MVTLNRLISSQSENSTQKKRDESIADAAVQQLRKDFAKGHILMARVGNVKRAEEVFKLYSRFPEFKPVQIHSGIKLASERARIRRLITSGKSRIVVCVDMLGEGFDLPELKIAAFHDIRQSLPITLQLAGRFTRAKAGLGNATIVANVAEVTVNNELRKLYQRDTDWNSLLPYFSDEAIKNEIELGQFIAGFKKFPDEVSLRNVRLAMSTVVYRTRSEDWNPENFKNGILSFETLERVYHDVNSAERTLVVVTAKRVPVDWARVDDIYQWDWQLYVLFHDRERKLLFIHNSSNNGFFKDLAKAVAGDVSAIKGPEIFRCVATVNRLRLQNVGLIETLGRLIRFTMRAGSDVEGGMSETQKQKAIKSNLFGTGYEDGRKASIGCSYKGRIWSQQTTNLREFTRWCGSLGTKLLDVSLDPEQVLRGTLQPVIVSKRPKMMPITVEWPEDFYTEVETAIQFEIGSQVLYMHELDINVENPTEDGPIFISLSTGALRIIFELEFFGEGEGMDFRFKQISGTETTIKYLGKKLSAGEFFTTIAPTIWFVDGSSLCGNELVILRHVHLPFPVARLETWDWSGIDICKESQGANRLSDSIQYRVIEDLKSQNFTVVFDDDGSGEAADVVAIRENASSIDVEFWHCKFSGERKSGARIKYLYELCGQAQRSVRWMQRQTELFSHLMRRAKRGRFSRFEVGADKDLERILEKSRICALNLSVTIVQPGVSKQKVTSEQLTLLGVTENYLIETFKVPLRVIVSP